MKKFKFGIIGILLLFVLIGCSSDDENEAADIENDTTNEEVDNEETEADQEEIDEEVEENATEEDSQEAEEEEDSAQGISEEERENLLERFDEHLLLGETGEFERSDITNDHVEITLNSFTFVDELDGEEPENDHFLLANVTIENLLSDEHYGNLFITGLAEGRTGGTIQNERDELAQEYNQDEPGVSTGNMVFDVEESDYYSLFLVNNYFLIFSDEQEEQSDSEK